LPDEEPETFDVVLRAIYAERIVWDRDTEGDKFDAVVKECTVLIKVYVACDKYDLKAIRHSVLTSLTTSYQSLLILCAQTPQNYPRLWTTLFLYTSLVYQNAIEKSPLRQFIARRVAHLCLWDCKVDDKFARNIQEIPEAAVDLSITLVRAAGRHYEEPLTWPLEDPEIN
jgi:hypothetical protein